MMKPILQEQRVTELFLKTIYFYRRKGLTLTLRRIASILSRDPKYTFSEIYRNNHWGNSESVSGVGSTEFATRGIREHLPIILSKWGITKLIDAPCGDFNWFKLVQLTKDMSYTGIDIVPALIGENNKKYADANHRFILADITTDPLPFADILICRDCLFHLSYKDIFKFLRNFVISGTPFLLTTTYKNESKFQNSDILTGEVRLIDLFSAPFSLPPNVAYRFDDFVPPDEPREMCLWNRDQIMGALSSPGPKKSVAAF
ncbi:MAG TPA: class I SAM-dependent methyltransferase [Methylocella sp.]|nr:class I SAM-dependent methyltransferase [Methylocella sp.]